MIELRPYQTEAVEKIESFRRPLLAAPTGSGKTVIAAEVIRRAPDSHVLFFAHRRELVTQAVARLEAVGIQAGMILAEKPTNHMARVQVASIQTLTARCIRGEHDLPPAKLVIVDEAHHAPSATYRALLARYPDSKIFGMTATPCRKDGRGLGGLFEALVETPQIPELIKLGYLVGTVTYAPSVPDLKGVRTPSR
jgi:DNA repair protein RadD